MVERYVVKLVHDAAVTSGGLVDHYSNTTFPATFTGLVSVTVNIISQIADTAALVLLDDDKVCGLFSEVRDLSKPRRRWRLWVLLFRMEGA